MKLSIRVSRVYREENGGFTNYSFGGFYCGQFGITTIIQFEEGSLKAGFNFHVAGKQLLGGLQEFKTIKQQNFNLYIQVRKEKINKAVSEAVNEVNSNLPLNEKFDYSSYRIDSRINNFDYIGGCSYIIFNRYTGINEESFSLPCNILTEDITKLTEKVKSFLNEQNTVNNYKIKVDNGNFEVWLTGCHVASFTSYISAVNYTKGIKTYDAEWEGKTIKFNCNPFLAGLEQDIKDNTTTVKHETTVEDFLPNLEDNYQAVSSPDSDDRNILLCQSCNEIFTGFFKNCPFCNSPYLTAKEEDLPVLPVLDLQLFASGKFTPSAPSHILFTEDTKEYITRNFFNGHGPDRVRQSGKLQNYIYVAGPFWGRWAGDSARELLELAMFLTGTKKGLSVVDCLAGACVGTIQATWKKVLAHDSVMRNLKKVLSFEGFKLVRSGKVLQVVREGLQD
jgi:hypothetical protein